MVPQEPLLCRQLLCFTVLAIVLPTQRAQLNPIAPLSCETQHKTLSCYSACRQFLCRQRGCRGCL